VRDWSTELQSVVLAPSVIQIFTIKMKDLRERREQRKGNRQMNTKHSGPIQRSFRVNVICEKYGRQKNELLGSEGPLECKCRVVIKYVHGEFLSITTVWRFGSPKKTETNVSKKPKQNLATAAKTNKMKWTKSWKKIPSSFWGKTQHEWDQTECQEC
jgi:hypothetical protein